MTRPSRLRVERTVAQVASEQGVPAAHVWSSRRDLRTVAARWEAWRRILAFNTTTSELGLANVWGCDHTSILNARRRGWVPVFRPGTQQVRPERRADGRFAANSDAEAHP